MREIVPGSLLFAASESSQLIFDMRGMDEESMAAFNGAVDEKGRRLWSECVDIVAREGMRPTFVGCGSEVLARNLLFVRESMADVLAWLYCQRLLVDTRTTGLSQLCHHSVRGQATSGPSINLVYGEFPSSVRHSFYVHAPNHVRRW